VRLEVLTAVLLNIKFRGVTLSLGAWFPTFRRIVVTSSSWSSRRSHGLLDLDDEENKTRRNVGIHSSNDTLSHSRIFVFIPSLYAFKSYCGLPNRSRMLVVFLVHRINVQLARKFHVVLHYSLAFLPTLTSQFPHQCEPFNFIRLLS
jgi:hypothetical protein